MKRRPDMPNFLVEETTVRECGESSVLDLGRKPTRRPAADTLHNSRQSASGSRRGYSRLGRRRDMESKPVASFLQKIHCGTYKVVLTAIRVAALSEGGLADQPLGADVATPSLPVFACRYRNRRPSNGRLQMHHAHGGRACVNPVFCIKDSAFPGSACSASGSPESRWLFYRPSSAGRWI